MENLSTQITDWLRHHINIELDGWVCRKLLLQQLMLWLRASNSDEQVFEAAHEIAAELTRLLESYQIDVSEKPTTQPVYVRVSYYPYGVETDLRIKYDRTL